MKLRFGRRRLRGAARALGGLVIALLAGCDGAGSRAAAGPLGFDRYVLVTLDTLRADHLGTYGYPFGTSPFIDALAERSVVFDRAYASMATTVPSHASLFTSLYPIQHGVLKNGLVLPAAHGTLAELMARAGFETGAFASTNAHFGVGGLDRGFASFDEPPRDEPGALPYREASATVGAALRWLEAFDAGDRFFLWIHLYDTHQPLRPPEPHRRAVEPRTEAEHAERVRFLHDEHHIPTGGLTPRGNPVFRRGDRGMLALHGAYDGEVHYMDAELRRLFEAFESRGLERRTLWILTSDHGEGLGSHDYKFHGKHLYDEQVRVPLIFYSAEPALVGRRVDAVVEHVDLLPTLAELVGGAGELAARRTPIQGRSLVAILRGQPATALRDRAAFVQRRSYAEEDRRSPLVDRDFEAGSKFALIGSRWKYIHRSEGDDELYDLAADPFETRDLVAREPERAGAMRTQLLDRVRKLAGATGPDPEAVDEATVERLRALGYAP